MRSVYVPWTLLFIVLLFFIFLFKKEIKKKIFSKKRIYISATLSKQDQKIVNLLNKVLADEWLAYYQYWVDAHVVVDSLKGDVVKELLQHALEEKKHADMLIFRIKEIGGFPILKFKDLLSMSNCGYTPPPMDGDVKLILGQNLNGEHCAVKVYNNLLNQLTDEKYAQIKKDIQSILKDEEEHIRDLNSLLNKI